MRSVEAHPLGLKLSRKLQDLNHDLELWQIGEDRLSEYTALFSRIYDDKYKYHLELNRTPEEILKIYRDFLARSVFMGVLRNDKIVTTGAALLAYSHNFEAMLPEDVVPIFDLPTLAKEHRAPEIWFTSRMAVDTKQITSREALTILGAVSKVTASVVGGDPDNIMIGVMEEKFRRLWRRCGVEYTIMDTGPMPFANGQLMHRAYVRAGDLAGTVNRP